MSDWPSTTPKFFAYWGIFCLFIASGGMATMAITDNMDLIKSRGRPLDKDGIMGFINRLIGLVAAVFLALLGFVFWFVVW